MKKLLAISLLCVGLNSSLNGRALEQYTTIFVARLALLAEKFNNSQKDQASDNKAKEEITAKVGVSTEIKNLSKGAQKLLEAKKPFGLLNIRDGVINYFINKITTGIIKNNIPQLIKKDNEKVVQNFALEELNKRIIKKFSPFKKDDCVSDALDLTVTGYNLYNIYASQQPLN